MFIEVPKKEIIAFDPGLSTGVVEIRGGKLTDNYTLSYDDLQEMCINQLIYPAEYVPWYNFEAWVVENYVLYPGVPQAFSDMPSSRVIGMLALTAKATKTKFILQNASNAKFFVNNDRLKEYGWWSKLGGDHERDAARHALYYLLVSNQKEKEERL